jgi:hypothetical protein
MIGQLAYERGSPCASPDAALLSAGIRLYEGVDARDERAQFLCVEAADTGEEAWYRINGSRLEPVSLQGLERLPGDPR